MSLQSVTCRTRRLWWLLRCCSSSWQPLTDHELDIQLCWCALPGASSQLPGREMFDEIILTHGLLSFLVFEYFPLQSIGDGRCVEFACSPCVHTAFLRVPWFPPTVQARLGRLKTLKLPWGMSVWVSAVCVPCEGLATCQGCILCFCPVCTGDRL